MLKEFLNLFRDSEKPTETVDHPHLEAFAAQEHAESTYLEFLFERIRPRVARRLEEHPETDPILEVATSVLLEMFPDYWEEADGPLEDRWSPERPGDRQVEPPSSVPGDVGSPPAPPAPPTGGPSEGPPAPPGSSPEQSDEEPTTDREDGAGDETDAEPSSDPAGESDREPAAEAEEPPEEDGEQDPKESGELEAAPEGEDDETAAAEDEDVESGDTESEEADGDEVADSEDDTESEETEDEATDDEDAESGSAESEEADSDEAVDSEDDTESEETEDETTEVESTDDEDAESEDAESEDAAESEDDHEEPEDPELEASDDDSGSGTQESGGSGGESEGDDEDEQLEVVEAREVEAEKQAEREEESEEIHDLDDLEVSEEGVQTDTPAGFASALDELADFEMPSAGRAPELSSGWPIAVDDPSVLQGARVLLAVLLDNDRLPADDQLAVPEVLMAAELWARLIVRTPDLEDRVKSLARLVEQKFGGDHFSQARLLLKLFPTNEETQLNNDRQLFFEDNIGRLGVREHSAEPATSDETIGGGLAGLELGDEDEVRRELCDLAESAGIEMHVYTRSPGAVDRWREVVEKADGSETRSYFLNRIPPRRWRGIDRQADRSVETVLREHIVRPMVRSYVIDHVKTCYFVLRTVGDTGLESYLDAFFDWSEETFDRNGVMYCPEIHERISTNRELIDPVFEDVYEQVYRRPVEEALEEFDDEALEASFAEAMERIGACDLTNVAAGNFDLGGFVLDAYLDFEYPSPEFAFGMHRLT